MKTKRAELSLSADCHDGSRENFICINVLTNYFLLRERISDLSEDGDLVSGAHAPFLVRFMSCQNEKGPCLLYWNSHDKINGTGEKFNVYLQSSKETFKRFWQTSYLKDLNVFSSCLKKQLQYRASLCQQYTSIWFWLLFNMRPVALWQIQQPRCRGCGLPVIIVNNWQSISAVRRLLLSGLLTSSVCLHSVAFIKKSLPLVANTNYSKKQPLWFKWRVSYRKILTLFCLLLGEIRPNVDIKPSCNRRCLSLCTLRTLMTCFLEYKLHSVL